MHASFLPRLVVCACRRVLRVSTPGHKPCECLWSFATTLSSLTLQVLTYLRVPRQDNSVPPASVRASLPVTHVPVASPRSRPPPRFAGMRHSIDSLQASSSTSSEHVSLRPAVGAHSGGSLLHQPQAAAATAIPCVEFGFLFEGNNHADYRTSVQQGIMPPAPHTSASSRSANPPLSHATTHQSAWTHYQGQPHSAQHASQEREAPPQPAFRHAAAACKQPQPPRTTEESVPLARRRSLLSDCGNPPNPPQASHSHQGDLPSQRLAGEAAPHGVDVAYTGTGGSGPSTGDTQMVMMQSFAKCQS
jgi:hypothetical protein